MLKNEFVVFSISGIKLHVKLSIFAVVAMVVIAVVVAMKELVAATMVAAVVAVIAIAGGCDCCLL